MCRNYKLLFSTFWFISSIYLAIHSFVVILGGESWCNPSRGSFSWIVCMLFNFLIDRNFLLALLISSIIIGLFKMWPKNEFDCTIKNTDIKLWIKVWNILDAKNIIVPINNHFDLSQPCIKNTTSILNAIIQKYYWGKYQKIQQQLKKEGIDINKEYPLWTSQKIYNKEFNKTFFFVANTYLDDDKLSHSTHEDFFLTIDVLFCNIKSDSNEELAIPLLNSWHWRIANIKRKDIIEYMIDQFILSTKANKKFCKKLTIYIYSKDIIEYEIDLDEIISDLRYCCNTYRRYSDFIKKWIPLTDS